MHIWCRIKKQHTRKTRCKWRTIASLHKRCILWPQSLALLLCLEFNAGSIECLWIFSLSSSWICWLPPSSSCLWWVRDEVDIQIKVRVMCYGFLHFVSLPLGLHHQYRWPSNVKAEVSPPPAPQHRRQFKYCSDAVNCVRVVGEEGCDITSVTLYHSLLAAGSGLVSLYHEVEWAGPSICVWLLLIRCPVNDRLIYIDILWGNRPQEKWRC